MTKFGVVIPTKGRDTLWQAIESVLEQTYQDFMIIVSCDSKVAFDMSIPNDKRITKIWLGNPPHNDSGAFARNSGIQYLTEDIEYITHIDDDDLFFKNRLELFNNFIEKYNNDLDCFYSYAILYKWKHIHPRSSEKRLKQVGMIDNVTAGGMCYKRSLFNRTKGWSPTNLESHDQELWVNMQALTDKWAILREPTFQFIWSD